MDNNSILNIIYSTFKKTTFVGLAYFAGYMQISLGWFVAPIIFLTLEERWRKVRNEKRAIIRASSEKSEESVIIGRLNDLPSWVVFPDFDRVEWMNKMLKQVWPNVNHYVRNLVKQVIEPQLKKNMEKYKFYGFKFEQILLGNVPFRIGGIKVYDTNVSRSEIIMDLDIEYAGDSKFTFSVAGLKAGIKDFHLHGLLRIVMRPLIPSFPLIGGLQVFFLNDPDIDFDLVGLADVLDLPGLSVILRKIVIENVASMMVLPNKLPIKLCNATEAIDVKSSYPIGVLRVHLVEAKHLMKKDIRVFGRGTSDPYAVLCVGAQKHKTPTIECTVDPKWDFWCEFYVYEVKGQELKLHIWDKDEASDDERLGSASIDIDSIARKGQDDVWISLEQVKHGMVHFRFIWYSLTSDFQMMNEIMKETQLLQVPTLSTALLTVFVDSAKDLPCAKPMKKPNPYAVLKIGHTMKKTNAANYTVNPIWEEPFTFFVANPHMDNLHVTIIDQKTNTELGRFTYSIHCLEHKPHLEVNQEMFAVEKAENNSKIVCSLQLRILKRGPIEVDQDSSTDQSHSKSEDANFITADSDGEENRSDEKQHAIEDELFEMNEKTVESSKSIDDSSMPQEDSVGRQLVDDFGGDETFIRQMSTSSASTGGGGGGEFGCGRVQLTLRYSQPRQKLIIIVHNVNIPMKDATTMPDPYVKLYLLPERAKESKRKTQVFKDNCNPVYDEKFEHTVSQSDIQKKQLEVTVCTQKQLFYSSSNVLGQAVIELSQLDLVQPFNGWFDLKPEMH